MAIQQSLHPNFGFHSMSHTLDDFMFIGPSNSTMCEAQLNCFLKIAEFAGIPIKESKTVHPTTRLSIRGIEVDTIACQACLPTDKLHSLQSLLSFSRSRSRTLRQWQSLIGHLSFASWVICPGRPYIRKFIDRTREVVNPSHFIHLTREIRHKCAQWLHFLHQNNGVIIITSKVHLLLTICLCHRCIGVGLCCGSQVGLVSVSMAPRVAKQTYWHQRICPYCFGSKDLGWLMVACHIFLLVW